ncbi:MAG: hypothetical protein M3188_02780 [Actinomycetota bacterium]|nr:hypothetical protein [Actinomycetota bacterium]
MRTIADIRAELEAATKRRTELWEKLAEGYDAEASVEATRLSRRIEQLWEEARIARAYARYGPSQDIITRARAEDRLDREARRFRDAA